MSGMEGIRGISGATSPAIQKLSAMREKLDPSSMAERMQGKLDEQLSSAGVSEETRNALLADLSAQIEGQMSSDSMRDPVAMKEAVTGIFEKHGLNAEDFIPQGPPMIAGKVGPMGGGGTQFESLQTLLESLQAKDDGGTNAAPTPSEYPSAILDYLFGIDKEA
jgi:hypothetical protein